ncbi:tyrosine-type recombinase/integrase [Spirosoma sp. HMF4905]|uniref:Tyrosine-type recombinase/integrase n=1 Tax=Spirosoma arboris TaxID=2682092 RepID=A0A7K1S3Q5_9BACT|nr:site-specific integrase [Spirosoma arboris]MVM28451.1 tyrosine-type recombinase/integrase [Spirosoma arboris]
MDLPDIDGQTAKGRTRTNTISFTVELGNKPKKDGQYSLYLRITENRKHRRVYIGFDIPLKDWNPNKKEVRRSYPLHEVINKKIDAIKSDAIRLKAESKNVNSEVIAENLKGRSSTYFFQYAYGYITNKPYNTQRNVRTEINKFLEYIDNKDLFFADITVKLLTDYENWLRTKKGNTTNTISKGLSKIRTIFNQAIKEGVLPMQDNPFLMIRLKEGKPERIRLTEKELEAFRTVPLPEDSLLWHTRNYWLCAFYMAGMRFSDISCLQWKNINGNRLSYVMQKTKNTVTQSHTIQLPKQAEEIILHYRSDKPSPTDNVFPILNPDKVYTTEADVLKEISRKNALINKYLKKICFLAGITKELSFHSARHTFADLGRKKVKDVYAISKLLRHSKINITEKYLSEFDTDTTDKALESIFG